MTGLNSHSTPLLFIVDDDPDDQSFLQQALKKFIPAAAFGVFVNGKEVMLRLQQAFTRLPDLIIMDLNMPVMGGYEVLQWIKKHNPFSKIPVVIFSTSQASEDIISCSRLGAADYLCKPATFDGYEEAAARICRKWFGRLDQASAV